MSLIKQRHGEGRDGSTSSSDDDGDGCCLICSEPYQTGEFVTALHPCNHAYHTECIVSWLSRRCTCPVCRYEFGTDHPTYEAERLDRMRQRRIDGVFQRREQKLVQALDHHKDEQPSRDESPAR